MSCYWQAMNESFCARWLSRTCSWLSQLWCRNEHFHVVTALRFEESHSDERFLRTVEIWMQFDSLLVILNLWEVLTGTKINFSIQERIPPRTCSTHFQSLSHKLRAKMNDAKRCSDFYCFLFSISLIKQQFRHRCSHVSRHWRARRRKII